MLQPNVNISSTLKADFSIKENNRKKITEADVKKALGRSSSAWKNPIPLSNFGIFDSAILSENIKLFVEKLNEISSKAPTFDLMSFLENEIINIKGNFNSYDDYYKQFSKDLDNQFQKVKGDLDKKIFKTLIDKVSPVFTDFGIANPSQTDSYKKLIGEINKYKIPPLTKWNFVQDNLKKIIDNLEKDQINSYQIDGLTGFYNKVYWDKEYDVFFDKSAQYDTKKSGSFVTIVIDSIVEEYKNIIKTFINKNQKTFEYRDLLEIQKKSKILLPLGQIDAIFPGVKAIIEKIQKHNNQKQYGSFDITFTNLFPNSTDAHINFNWNYNGKPYNLIGKDIRVQNSKSDVQTAIKRFKDNYLSLINPVKIDPDLDFSFRGLAKAKSIKVGQVYNDLMSNQVGEMTIQEFLDFIKYSGKDYNEFKKIIDDIINSKNNLNNKLNVDFKVTYQIDDLESKNLLLKLIIWDKSFSNPNKNNKDQIDSVNLTRPANRDDESYPKISIKLISKEITSLLSGEKFEIAQQDFVDFDPKKTNKLDINYLKKLPINKDKEVNVKKYNNIGELFDWYTKLGLNLKDIEVDALVRKNKNETNNYSIIFSAVDKSLTGYKLPSSHWSAFGSISVITLEEQLDKLNILKILYEYTGKPNSKFDTKNLTQNIDGPNITVKEINESLKLNDKNTTSSKTRTNIIDRIHDIFNAQSSKSHTISFANTFPAKIKWIVEKYNTAGHGLIWKFNFTGISAFDSSPTSLDSNDYGVVYEFALATLADKENSKKVVEKHGNNSIDAINKNPLVTEEKWQPANQAINDINKVMDDYVDKINNRSLGWSALRLKKEEAEAILKITKISEEIAKNISAPSIIKEISKILGRQLTDKETEIIAERAKLFADLLDITKDKKILEEIIKNKALANKLAKVAGKPIFKDTLKALLKIKDNYQYAYLGTGIASGIAGLGAAAAFVSSLRANKRIKKMNGKQAKIKGAKLISIITAFVTLGSMSTSIVTLLWFFISKGGI